MSNYISCPQCTGPVELNRPCEYCFIVTKENTAFKTALEVAENALKQIMGMDPEQRAQIIFDIDETCSKAIFQIDQIKSGFQPVAKDEK